MNIYLFLAIIVALIIFIIYLAIDLGKSSSIAFMDKWSAKTLWIWLPFYALYRLIKEVVLKEK